MQWVCLAHTYQLLRCIGFDEIHRPVCALADLAYPRECVVRVGVRGAGRLISAFHDSRHTKC